MRRLAELLTLLLVAAVAMRAWYAGSVSQQVLVVGPSMAPTLLGSHVELTCVDCGYRFACEPPDESSREPPAICPNCGAPQPEAAPAALLPGDSLVVDKRAFRSRGPRRWETVVFRSPEDPSNYCIKRVVGLPGETVEIVGGDVWINGAPARKTLAEQHLLAIPVSDSRYQPRPESHVPPSWRPVGAHSGWTAAGDGFRHVPPLIQHGRDWLQFTHYRRVVGHPGEFEPAPVDDSYAYSRTATQPLNDVADLLLVARLRAQGRGKLLLKANVRGLSYVAVIEPERGTGWLLLYDTLVPGTMFAAGAALLAQPSTVEFSVIDSRLLLAVDGRLLIQHDYASAKLPVRESFSPLAIGAEGIEVSIDRLKVLRDVYYTRPTGPGGRFGVGRPYTLGGEEYYVLGDNSTISADSRTGLPAGGLPARFLLGPATPMR